MYQYTSMSTNSHIIPSASPKYAEIADALRLRVRCMPGGQRLQPVRELMREFEVSQATIYSALELLKQEGAVIHEPGRGVRKPESDNGGGVASVLLMVAERSSPFHERLVFELCERARRHRLRFMVETLSSEQGIMDHTWPIADFRAGVAIPGKLDLPAEHLMAWRRRGQPIVVMDRDMRQVGVDSVFSHPYRGGVLAARHLLGLGHRRLAVVVHRPDSINLVQRVEGFVDEVNDHPEASVVVHSAPRPLGNEELVPFTKELVREHRDVTGVFGLTHSSSLVVLRVLQESGVQVPSQISVVGYDYLQSHSHPTLTTVDQPIHAMADAACRIIRRRLSGDSSAEFSEMIRVELNARSSTTHIA